MQTLARNLRFAMRQLCKSPAFALTVILTLALGIGATTAVFSLVEGILLRPLPFASPDRLVVLGDLLGTSQHPGVTAREIGTYSNATHAFASLGGYASTSYELSSPANQTSVPEEISAARFTASVFPTLGVQPALGRVFSPQEEEARQPLAVISDALWLTRFNRDPQVLGKSVFLDRKSYTIIGVMPRSFEFPLRTGLLDRTQLWVPLSLTGEELSDENAGSWRYQLIAHLRDDITLVQANQDADRVAKQVMRDFPPTMAAIRIQGHVTPLLESAIANVRPVLRTLFLAVIVVLVIACANVAGLLLVRAIRRRREYAVRLALGATASAILRESCLEGLLLSLSGGLLGLALAAAAIRTALHVLPESMPRLDSISINPTVVLFALSLALATGILSSLAPAFAALRTNLTESLKSGARSGTGASSHPWLRSGLVISEIAIALILLTVSAAFLRSYQKMSQVDPGFRPEHVIVAAYQLPLQQYPSNAAVTQFNRSVINSLSAQPGVLSVSLTNSLPASNYGAASAYTVEGASATTWKLKFANFAVIQGDYFKTLNIPLLDGRVFTPHDNANAPLVIVMNQTMANHCWPGQRAVGKRMHVGNPRKQYPWATVIGVVADTKLGSRDEPDSEQWYAPAEQPATLNGIAASEALVQPTGGFITLRSLLPIEEATRTLRSGVAHVDPQLALERVGPMAEMVANVEAPRSFNTSLISAFALIALLLAITGIYAVVAFSVSLRTQEIAVRVAVGAQRTAIARMVLLSGARLAACGCALGLLGSLAAAHLVNSFLFGITATDPLIYAESSILMLLLALAASAVPASRAASTDPITALRSM